MDGERRVGRRGAPVAPRRRSGDVHEARVGRRRGGFARRAGHGRLRARDERRRRASRRRERGCRGCRGEGRITRRLPPRDRVAGLHGQDVARGPHGARPASPRVAPRWEDRHGWRHRDPDERRLRRGRPFRREHVDARKGDADVRGARVAPGRWTRARGRRGGMRGRPRPRASLRRSIVRRFGIHFVVDGIDGTRGDAGRTHRLGPRPRVRRGRRRDEPAGPRFELERDRRGGWTRTGRLAAGVRVAGQNSAGVADIAVAIDRG